MAWTRTATLPEKDWVEPRHRKVDRHKEYLKHLERREKARQRRQRTDERKARRRPGEWGPEEKDNPDYYWRCYLQMKEGLLRKNPPASSERNVAAFLRVSRKLKNSPEEPMTRFQRGKMFEQMKEFMTQWHVIPNLWWFRRKYKELKKK